MDAQLQALQELKAEIKAEVQELKVEMKAEVQGQLKANANTLRAEMKAEVRQLRTAGLLGILRVSGRAIAVCADACSSRYSRLTTRSRNCS